MITNRFREFKIVVHALRGFAMAVSAAALLVAAPQRSAANEPIRNAEPGAPHVSADRSGSIETKDGLTLRLTTDLGTVRVVPLDPSDSPVVRYSVHLETDARGPMAKTLLDRYSLSAKPSPAGVEIIGTLPPQAAHATGVQYWVQFEVEVP